MYWIGSFSFAFSLVAIACRVSSYEYRARKPPYHRLAGFSAIRVFVLSGKSRWQALPALILGLSLPCAYMVSESRMMKHTTGPLTVACPVFTHSDHADSSPAIRRLRLRYRYNVVRIPIVSSNITVFPSLTSFSPCGGPDVRHKVVTVPLSDSDYEPSTVALSTRISSIAADCVALVVTLRQTYKAFASRRPTITQIMLVDGESRTSNGGFVVLIQLSSRHYIFQVC